MTSRDNVEGAVDVAPEPRIEEKAGGEHLTPEVRRTLLSMVKPAIWWMWVIGKNWEDIWPIY